MPSVPPPTQPPPQTPTATPPSPGSAPIEPVWIDFTNSVKLLLVPQPDDRPLDQYLAFRDTVLTLVQSPDFLGALRQAWPVFTNSPRIAEGDALIQELKAFYLSAEVAQATEKLSTESKSWWKRLLGRASTTTGSVKDIMDTLPATAKAGLTLFKEVIDIFKGGE